MPFVEARKYMAVTKMSLLKRAVCRAIYTEMKSSTEKDEVIEACEAHKSFKWNQSGIWGWKSSVYQFSSQSKAPLYQPSLFHV